MRIFSKRLPLLALTSALSLSACVGDGDSVLPETNAFVGGALFARYVSLGNSITAGYQSGGINATTQVNAYPVLLAARAQAVFYPPLIAGPGCPPLMTAPLTPAPAPAPGSVCARTTTPPFVSNLAVPGERIQDLVTFNPAASNALLHTLLVGPRSQTEEMLRLDPTLVSVWIGNNDALAAAVLGNLGPATAGADSLLTRLSSFNASLAEVVNRVDQVIDAQVGQEDAILIGVVDPVLYAPILQPGAYFWLARDASGNFRGKPVNANCAPVNLLGQPNPLSANMVSFQILATALPQINCDPAAQGGAFLLDTSEQAFVRQRVAAFNASLSAAASANGWMYVDPGAILQPLLNQTDAAGRYQNIRKCQLLATAQTAAQFQTAVLNSCPVTGPTAAPNFFGSLISFDGVHPSTAAHQILARTLAAAINAKHGTALPTS